MKNKSIKKSGGRGFSLIELSIVLIIIGLLVAGITGGASLIKSAKLSSLINEVNNYKRAFVAYTVEYGHLPAYCLDNQSTMGGECDFYKDNDSFYDDYSNWSASSWAPFYEMSKAGIIKYNKVSNDRQGQISSVFSSFGYLVYNSFKKDNGNCYSNSKSLCKDMPTNILELRNMNYNQQSSITLKDTKQIDTKIDDGSRLSGKMSAYILDNNEGSFYETDYDLDYDFFISSSNKNFYTQTLMFGLDI